MDKRQLPTPPPGWSPNPDGTGAAKPADQVGLVVPVPGYTPPLPRPSEPGPPGSVAVAAHTRRPRRRPRQRQPEPQLGLFESLEEARAELRAGLDKGTRCKCCDQYARRYRRKITSSMAWGLSLIARYHLENPQADWIHVEDYLKAIPDLPSKVRGDVARLRRWELIERLEGKRPDGSSRSGFYRITTRGLRFLEGELAVQAFAVEYNGALEGFEGDKVTIRDCWDEAFDYRELMRPPDGQKRGDP